MDNVALPLLPSQRPPGGRGDPTATNIWWTPSVYDGHAQLPPSLGTDSALTPSYNRFAWMQYPDPTIWNPSPPPLLPFQELPENIRQVGSSRGSLMVESSLYNLARYDAPKCDEDTRVEVTSEIMEWIQDREGPQRLLCMTGAAGAGKSALQQTIAEICEKGDILAISFFFSVADPSRNTIKAFVPTIAYQLGRRNPDLKRRMKHAVEDEPLIFSQSLQAQMDALIVGPFKNLRDMETNVDFRTLPYAILIDGLDECKGEDRQAELLTAIRRCLLADDLPFRIFVASRPEWAIRTALLSGGHLHTLAYHIQLSDRYDATEDMRRYLRRRFLDIGLRIGNFRWFTEEDIHLLAERASGQFVYVATAFKYISERRACPVHRLKTVLDWTPRDGQGARPFEALDVLYTSILSAAKEAYEGIDTHSGHDFIFLVRILQMDTIDEISPLGKNLPAVLSSLLGMESNAVGLLISDLRSIFSFDLKDMDCLRLYHKSFSDFLGEESRAKDLYVPAERVRAHFAKCCMQFITEFQLDFNDRLPDKWEDLPIYETRRDTLLQAIMDLGFLLECDIDDDVVEFTRKGGWQQIHKLLPLILHPKADSQFWSDWFWLLGLYIDERDWQVLSIVSINPSNSFINFQAFYHCIVTIQAAFPPRADGIPFSRGPALTDRQYNLWPKAKRNP
ncbi:hypothetical protein EST38_g5779 [Candolleomyces aberdarensis]|uniref:Nephrocystin 3-like N-terminal domain-containing protein n=1 Tax=Candolleomyces aberdarensis TaxID=2316362 RepID=A0A4Q2DJ80_9AGAR|nr:hypothetical protein EST38_g5779 [Candolleomyces aberdarensis]